VPRAESANDVLSVGEESCMYLVNMRMLPLSFDMHCL